MKGAVVMADETTVVNPFAELGFDDPAKALDAFKSMKLDLAKHKTRADSVTAMETELETLRSAQQAKEDAEKTELQKMNDRLAKIENEKNDLMARATASERKAMLERGLAENLSGVPDKLRPIVQKYMRTVLPGMEWADAEALKAQITENLTSFNEILPEELRVVSSGTLPPKTPGAAPAGDKPIFDMQSVLHPDR